jgi:hypothetical protein
LSVKRIIAREWLIIVAGVLVSLGLGIAFWRHDSLGWVIESTSSLFILLYSASVLIRSVIWAIKTLRQRGRDA